MDANLAQRFSLGNSYLISYRSASRSSAAVSERSPRDSLHEQFETQLDKHRIFVYSISDSEIESETNSNQNRKVLERKHHEYQYRQRV